MISVAIVEDEISEAEKLKTALKTFEQETGTEFDITEYRNAEKFLVEYNATYDIVFMDIVLPGMDGIAAAHELRKKDDHVYLIFLTNMGKLAIRGYEVNAVDFLIKPCKYYDLKMRLLRVCDKIGDNQNYMTINVRGAKQRIIISDIYFIESQAHLLTYHTRLGDFESYGGSMKMLEEDLSKYGFARCSVCYLVNIQHCNKIEGDIAEVGPYKLHITRGKKKSFIEAFKEHGNMRGGG